MSQQIDQAFVQQFSSNIYMLAQQKGSRFQPHVRNEQHVGESVFYERVGAVAAAKKTSRHSKTPQMDTPHSRRRVTVDDFNWADLIDKEDQVRLLIDPTSAYAQAAMWALGRSKDDEVIFNATGNAYSGQNGATAVPLPQAQILAAVDGATLTGVNLNVQTLRRINQSFEAAEIDPSIERYIACQSSQMYSLLGDDKVINMFYNEVRPLVDGQVDKYMGFTFVRTERLAKTTATVAYDPSLGTTGAGAGTAPVGARMAIAWCEDGLLLSTGRDITGRISERDDLNYSTQVYASMSIGATRMEEVKVIEVLCTEL